MKKPASDISWEKYLKAKKIQLCICITGWFLFLFFVIYCLTKTIPLMKKNFLTELLLSIFVLSLFAELTLALPNTIINSYSNYTDLWKKWILLCYSRMPSSVKKRIVRYKKDMQPIEVLSLFARRMKKIGFIFLCIAILAEISRIALLIYLIKTNIFYSAAFNELLSRF